MVDEERWGWQPSVSPSTQNAERQPDLNWTQFDSSVNAVSLGFVATAILISMFIIMAIFEKFLRFNTPENGVHRDLEAQLGFHPKLGFPSPKMTVYSQGLSVLMPGEATPTFIAQPLPLPCPPDRIQWPPFEHKLHPNTLQCVDRSTIHS
ncbi:hypothetical protein vseg_011391 [Gypsophila vaccaria]